MPGPGVVPVSAYSARQRMSFIGRDRRTEHPLDHDWQRLVGVDCRLGTVGNVPPPTLPASPGLVCLHLPKATRFGGSATVGIGAFVSEPELSGLVQLLDCAYERTRILLQILWNPRAETEVVVRGSKAVGREADEAGPQICMPDARGQALVADPSLVRVEAAHPRTLRPAEHGSHFAFSAIGSAPAMSFTNRCESGQEPGSAATPPSCSWTQRWERQHVRTVHALPAQTCDVDVYLPGRGRVYADS